MLPLSGLVPFQLRGERDQSRGKIEKERKKKGPQTSHGGTALKTAPVKLMMCPIMCVPVEVGVGGAPGMVARVGCLGMGWTGWEVDF